MVQQVLSAHSQLPGFQKDPYNHFACAFLFTGMYCSFQRLKNVKLTMWLHASIVPQPMPRFHQQSDCYRIAGNFRRCKFSRKSAQTLQKKFSRFLFSRMRDSLATPLSVDGHAPYAKRHWTTKRRSKPVQQRPDLPFVWRLSKLRRYQDCRRGRETGALDSALLISTSTTAERLTDSLVFCIVAGWFFFTATI